MWHKGNFQTTRCDNRKIESTRRRFIQLMASICRDESPAARLIHSGREHGPTRSIRLENRVQDQVGHGLSFSRRTLRSEEQHSQQLRTTLRQISASSFRWLLVPPFIHFLFNDLKGLHAFRLGTGQFKRTVSSEERPGVWRLCSFRCPVRGHLRSPDRPCPKQFRCRRRWQHCSPVADLCNPCAHLSQSEEMVLHYLFFKF